MCQSLNARGSARELLSLIEVCLGKLRRLVNNADHQREIARITSSTLLSVGESARQLTGTL